MKPGMGWPIAVACILGVTVIGNIAVMVIANDDPSFAIESNYYQKAVDFDSTMGLERESVKLGWQATGAIERVANEAHVVITLRDVREQAITGAAVYVDAIFNARANEVLRVVLQESEPGRYVAPLVVAHAGIWELRINARRVQAAGDTAHFYSSTRVDVPATVGASLPGAGSPGASSRGAGLPSAFPLVAHSHAKSGAP